MTTLIAIPSCTGFLGCSDNDKYIIILQHVCNKMKHSVIKAN